MKWPRRELRRAKKLILRKKSDHRRDSPNQVELMGIDSEDKDLHSSSGSSGQLLAVTPGCWKVDLMAKVALYGDKHWEGHLSNLLREAVSSGT